MISFESFLFFVFIFLFLSLLNRQTIPLRVPLIALDFWPVQAHRSITAGIRELIVYNGISDRRLPWDRKKRSSGRSRTIYPEAAKHSMTRG